MKRLFLLVLGSWIVASGASADTNTWFINRGTYIFDSPPQLIPQIDANYYINYGIIGLNTSSNHIFPVATLFPFESQNTLFYTNFGTMSADPGFRFDHFDSGINTHGSSSAFVNQGSVNDASASILGETWLHVAATNIVNRGQLAIGGSGWLKLDGGNVDLIRSRLVAVGNDTNAAANVQNVYWGTGTNSFDPVFEFGSLPIFGPATTVTTIQDNYYARISQQLQLTNGFVAYADNIQTGPTNAQINILFLSQTNPLITTEVRFSPPGADIYGEEKMIKWQAIVTNRVTGQILTNQIYLDDFLGFFPGIPQLTSPFGGFFFPGFNPFNTTTFQPENYALTAAPPGAWDFSTDTALWSYDPTIFNGAYRTVSATNTAWGVNLTASAYSPDPAIAGNTWTNIPDRIEINAGSVLDLTHVQIGGQSYLRVYATNHFVGSTNAQIISPVSDFNLATTNRGMTIVNLTTPTIPNMSGTIEVWSGHWTNIQGNFELNYNITVVDSRLVPEVPSLIQDMKITARDLVVNDALNIFNTLTLPITQSLTVTTNPPPDVVGNPVPATSTGEINLMTNNLIWSASFPQLQYVTNFGKITAGNAIYFARSVTPPLYAGVFDGPYQTFVNHGYVAAEGNFTWANYFESSGTNDSGVGPLSIQGVSQLVTNGQFNAGGDISLTSGFLFVSNHVLNATRAINLNVTNWLTDGVANIATLDPASQLTAYVTNGNGWKTGFGLNLGIKPVMGDLLGTTITNTAFLNQSVPIVWAGEDRGVDPSGFLNNAAIGCLILDGQANCSFAFGAAGARSALYVDLLILTNWPATNWNTSGDLLAASFGPNMKVYYGDALANGISIAEKLSGRNGGGFNWASNYNYGYFSSIVTNYSDGVGHRLNRPLYFSCDLDSNDNHINNCQDIDPIPIVPWTPAVSDILTNFDPFIAHVPAPPDLLPIGGGGTNPISGGTNNHFAGPVKLTFPTLGALVQSGQLATAIAAAQGTYNGLFSDTNGAAVGNSGYVSLKTTTRGTYTGKLFLQGKSYPFSGIFNSATARSTVTVPGVAGGGVVLQLQLDVSGGDQLRGSLSGSGISAELLADRLVFSKSSNKASAGSFTLTMAPGTNGPGGYGYATVKVDAGGTVTWVGALGDGAKVSGSTTKAKTGFWPFYSSLYAGKGVTLSWMEFIQQAGSDLSGQGVWLNPAGATPSTYPRGFTNEVITIGSAYTRPSGGSRVLNLNNSRGNLVLAGGILGQAVSNAVTMDGHGRANGPTGSRTTLTVNQASGLFTGSILNPATGRPIKFQGVVNQAGNFAAGNFVAPNSTGQSWSGSVLLTPAP